MSNNPLRPSKAPSIPLAPEDYNRGFLDQLTSALRLYFNQVDNSFAAVLQDAGGAYLGFPHIAALDTTTQYASGNDTPTKVVWNATESLNGFTLNPAGYASPTQSGVYKIDYSLQTANTANAVHDVVVWLRVNNVDVPASASKFTLAARKNATTPSYVVAYSSVTFYMDANDRVELWWATDQAFSLSPATDGVYLQALPAQTTPYPHPLSPSAIGAITFVSRLPTDLST